MNICKSFSCEIIHKSNIVKYWINVKVQLSFTFENDNDQLHLKESHVCFTCEDVHKVCEIVHNVAPFYESDYMIVPCGTLLPIIYIIGNIGGLVYNEDTAFFCKRLPALFHLHTH